jgi:methyltransferase (TIGR00027 family)
VKRNKSSQTGIGIALCRASESRRPEIERICHDPYAHHFLPLSFHVVARIPFLINYIHQKRRRRSPGILEAIVSRVRYMDDFLLEYIADGLEQFVSPGAGFDTRPYRMDALKVNVRVFEVNHPATQTVKKKKLIKIFGVLPAHVTFVPVHFNTQDLGQRSMGNGFDRTLKTLFIWEGVVMYLTPETVDKTLAFVRDCSLHGNTIIFDYIPSSAVSGFGAPKERKELKRDVEKKGEALIFAFEPQAVEAYLRKRGFDRVVNINAQDLQTRYFTDPNAGRKISRVLNFVSARVKG